MLFELFGNINIFYNKLWINKMFFKCGPDNILSVFSFIILLAKNFLSLKINELINLVQGFELIFFQYCISRKTNYLKNVY